MHSIGDSKDLKSPIAGDHSRTRAILTDRVVADLGLWPTLGRLDHRVRNFLGRTEVKGRNILEIGCGNGAFLIWCWANGARRCVGLEPEADGSTSGSARIFENSIRALGCGNDVELVRSRVEDLSPDDRHSYDLVLLYNVVNHLDESACARLEDDPVARRVYVDAFKNIGRLLRHDGKVIVADCGRNNLYGDLGIKNPFASNIDWSKHQNPRVWKEILRAAGFVPGALRWYRVYPLRHLGILFSNRLIAYFTYSHFVLEFHKE